MRRNRPANPKTAIGLAIVAMVVFVVWLLFQMAPDAPAHGANLIRIGVGFGFVGIAALGLALFPPRAGGSGDDR